MIQTMAVKTLAVASAAGWLDDLQSWLWDLVKKYYNALWNFWTDVLLAFLKMLRDVALWVLNHVPVPDFIAHHSIGEYLGQAGPVIGWLTQQLRLADAMALILAGVVFRLMRRLLTLGIW